MTEKKIKTGKRISLKVGQSKSANNKKRNTPRLADTNLKRCKGGRERKKGDKGVSTKKRQRRWNREVLSPGYTG